MPATSKDLRVRILDALEEDSSSLRVGARFGVSASLVRKLRAQVEREGHCEPLYHGGRKRIVEEHHESVIEELVKANPNATLNELRRGLRKQTGLKVSEPTMSRALKKLGITKKKKVVEASERQREDVKAKRQSFVERAATWDADRMVFIDETGINLAMTPRYGWGPRGDRVVGHAPFHRGENATLVAALTTAGIDAPFLFPGAMDAQALRAYVAEVLVPRLHRDDIVLWDNLRVHEDRVVAELLGRKGIRLEFLPPYSPDLNPIELAWSKVKRQLREMEERSWRRLTRSVRLALRNITGSECENWVRHCGYAA